jgi:peptidoglycan hydrolase-like protein with peptidoglycan-binding domain
MTAPTASVAAPEVTAPTNDVPAQEPAVPLPSHSEPANRDLATPLAERPEPPTTTCTVALDPWPADVTEQGKAIQVLLRDLGFYSGPTSGTVGPLTRAAIRKFQLAAKEAATGEPSKVLFESLKKKKCASIAP